MRKVLFGLLMLGVAGGLLAQTVVGTAHDMSADEPNGEICVFCHTPHGAVPDVPLWNHDLSAQTYTAYDSATMDAADNANWTGAGGSISAMCMACHDGTIGLGALVNDGPLGAPANAATLMGAVAANLGTDLTNDHPVVFTYDAALVAADGELNAVPVGGFANGVRLYGAASETMECASCHDVHNTPGAAPFLVTTNAGSALCLTCHVK